MARLWEKGQALDALVLDYTAGEDHRLDDRLVAYDVRASCAHARMLAKVGLLEPAETDALCGALEQLGKTHALGHWQVSLEEEDCHTALEQRLTAMLGETGGRIHLGRSRNDQVLAALRLYLRDAVGQLQAEAEAVAQALEGLAERQGALVMPGYTHFQQAMPSSVGLWALGFAAEIRDDIAGLEGVRRRIEKNPLGSAAGYGVPLLPLDREHTRQALEFWEVQSPVTAVQLSRGKAEAQLLFELSLLMQDVGRLAAELVLFASQEFGFVRLPEAMTTGSSIMPQKRNPDVFELVRGRSGQAQAALLEVLSIPAKLPSGYHRDLQGIKGPLFRGIDAGGSTLRILAHALSGVTFVPERMVLDPGLYAAERAYRLVLEHGLPFREAYRRVARGEG